jgi:hypothetical protein
MVNWFVVLGFASVGSRVAVVEDSQCHHGFGMGGVPASSASFAMGDGLALGFGWAAANLPMLFFEIGDSE